MTTPDSNTPTPETSSEQGTSTTGVARTGFSRMSKKSKPGGKKDVKTKIFLKGPSESRRSPDQRSHRGSTEHQGGQCLAADSFVVGDRWGAQE
ncbi:hypothetical protein E4U24_003557 [Claviceps purpurea]|nr:hypothetical protein E4U24_003557 [Claviceps purpurea]